MKVIKGISASSGIAQGLVCVYDNKIKSSVPHYSIDASRVPAEVNRLNEAFKNAKDEMRKMIEMAKSRFDEKAAEVFNTHLLILNDAGLYEKMVKFIGENSMNAEHAVEDIFNDYVKRYEAQGGHFKELTHDLLDAQARIISAFGRESGHFRCSIGEKRPVVVAANQLTPSMVLNIPKEHALAFVTMEGGYTSHATILAKSFGVPILFGIDIEKELGCGAQVVVDGSSGKLIISPDEKTKRYYAKKIENAKKKKLVCDLVEDKKHAERRKRKNIYLKMNISVPEEFDFAEEYVHDGVGLLRTEFLFMRKDSAPSEDEQYAVYKSILEKTSKPVTIRSLDISNDKKPPFLELDENLDPDKGFRGAVVIEKLRDLYITQFKALLRANTKGNLRILYPMVADVNDFYTYRKVLAEAKSILKKEKVRFNGKKIMEGAMIETPAAAMLADELMKEADFVNIGSNDLLQYTLAFSRGNYLNEKRYHILHPALAKLIESVVRAGRKAKKEVCLCGEIASFEEFYPLLIQAGLKSFSVSVSKFPDIQCEIYHLKDKANKSILKDFYKLRAKEEADKFFSKFI